MSCYSHNCYKVPSLLQHIHPCALDRKLVSRKLTGSSATSLPCRRTDCIEYAYAFPEQCLAHAWSKISIENLSMLQETHDMAQCILAHDLAADNATGLCIARFTVWQDLKPAHYWFLRKKNLIDTLRLVITFQQNFSGPRLSCRLLCHDSNQCICVKHKAQVWISSRIPYVLNSSEKLYRIVLTFHETKEIPSIRISPFYQAFAQN